MVPGSPSGGRRRVEGQAALPGGHIARRLHRGRSRRFARARPDELERFLSLYPAGRDLSPDLAHALGNLHLRAEARTLSGSDDRVPIEAFLEALGRSRMAGFAPDRRSGFELAFVHTYQPEGRRDGQRFELEAVHAPYVSEILDRHGVAVRAGHHCAQPLMDRLGVTATARASFGVYTTTEEIDRLVEGLEDARRVFA